MAVQARDLEPAPDFVPIPESGRVFRGDGLVGPGDVAADGSAHLDAIVRWIQEFAYEDIVDCELADDGPWVVRRSHVLVRRVPRFGEPLKLATFCGGIGASVAERRTRIEGANGADVDAAVLWVGIDNETRTPKRFSERFRSIYAPSANGRRASSRLRHPSPPEGATRSTWRYGAADVDLADHVNNVAVVRTLTDVVLGAGAHDGLELEAEYRRQTAAGDVAVLSAENGIWVVGDEGEPTYASLTLSGLAGSQKT